MRVEFTWTVRRLGINLIHPEHSSFYELLFSMPWSMSSYVQQTVIFVVGCVLCSSACEAITHQRSYQPLFMAYLLAHIRPIVFSLTVVNLGLSPRLYIILLACPSRFPLSRSIQFMYFWGLDWIVAQFLLWPPFRNQQLLHGFIMGCATIQTVSGSVCGNQFLTLWYLVCSMFYIWFRSIALQT